LGVVGHAVYFRRRPILLKVRRAKLEELGIMKENATENF
jgi:hypothetical protein